jgi:hypothetical protein
MVGRWARINSREEIVFTRLVHNAEHFVVFGFFIGENLINLA